MEKNLAFPAQAPSPTLEQAWKEAVEREGKKSDGEIVEEGLTGPYYFAKGVAQSSLGLLEQGWQPLISGIQDSHRGTFYAQQYGLEKQTTVKLLQSAGRQAAQDPPAFAGNLLKRIEAAGKQTAIDFLKADHDHQSESVGRLAPHLVFLLLTDHFTGKITRAEPLPEGFQLRKFPLGMKDSGEFKKYTDMIFKATQDALGAEKDPAVFVGVRGSAATGLRFRGGVFGPDSDIDLFVVSDKLYEEGLARGAWDRNGTLSVGATQKYFSPELTDVEKAITERIQSYPGAAEGREARIRILGQRGYERLAQGNEIIQAPSWLARSRLQWNQIKTQFHEGEALWKTIFGKKD